MDPNAALQIIRAIVTEAKRMADPSDAYMSDDYEPLDELNTLAGHIEALDEWIGNGGFLPAAWSASTRLGPNDLHALSEITDACIHGYKVARLIDGDNVIEGVARSIGDDKGNFLRRDEDVRNGYLRVSGTFEYFWPIRELMPQVHDSTFVVQRDA